MPLYLSDVIQVILAALIPDVPGDIELLKAKEFYIQHQRLMQELNAAEDEKDTRELGDDVIIE